MPFLFMLLIGYSQENDELNMQKIAWNSDFNNTWCLHAGEGCYSLSLTTLSNLRGQWEIHGLKPSQTHCSLQNYFASYLVFIPCLSLNHKFTPSMLVWLPLGNIHALSMNSGRNIYSTSWSTQLLIGVQGHAPVPFVMK